MDCPMNESIWKKRAERYKCQDEDIYHCLLLEDKSNVKEVCHKQARIGKGKYSNIHLFNDFEKMQYHAHL